MVVCEAVKSQIKQILPGSAGQRLELLPPPPQNLPPHLKRSPYLRYSNLLHADWIVISEFGHNCISEINLLESLSDMCFMLHACMLTHNLKTAEPLQMHAACRALTCIEHRKAEPSGETR